VVRQNEVESFQWLVQMLTEQSYELKKGKVRCGLGHDKGCDSDMSLQVLRTLKL
jgi:hypothetical protein